MRFKYEEYIRAFSAFDDSYTEKAKPTLFDAKKIYENTNNYLDSIANTCSTDNDLNKIVQTIRQLNTLCCAILCRGLKGQFSFDANITMETALAKLQFSTDFAQDVLKRPYSFLDTIVAYEKSIAEMKLNSQSISLHKSLSDGDRLLLSSQNIDTPFSGQRFGGGNYTAWTNYDSMTKRTNNSLFFSGGLAHLQDQSSPLIEEEKIAKALMQFRQNVLITQNYFGIEVPENYRQEENPYDDIEEDFAGAYGKRVAVL
ncbi:hypothetical protein BN59_00684 [Legionella massiliensis]|uniref:Uncharacterized protein n=1 Tax=Legionella massiliensis TaxID=1034943 RepID=A0A078KPY0_9GAMM|nr:hypothetical protein [Legionella massiliensis]CDZ76415.1 hypothetical protein BN59_00684 [Legionella massiliensis]CEE12153.1 hypothetical protein BN1094_00684 [Legionella massiliensis]